LIITSIIKQKGNQNRYNIFINGNFSFSASNEDIVKHSIKEGLELSEELFNTIRIECEHSKAYNYALHLLEIRGYTSKEIKRKLKLKNYSEKTIDDILTKLKSYNFIDDHEYAEKYISDCVNFKKYGKKKIIYNLKSKGIEPALIDNAEFDYEMQYENAYLLANKKLRILGNKPNQKEKTFQYLASRGYELDLIIKVIKKIFHGTDNGDMDLYD
jgi:regulatory protein